MLIQSDSDESSVVILYSVLELPGDGDSPPPTAVVDPI